MAAGPDRALSRDRPPAGRAALAAQFDIIDQLYEEMLSHHGIAIGPRHARKHLGWALDAAAETAGAPEILLKSYRSSVLTSDDPAAVRRHLAEAFDSFGAWERAAA